LPTGFIWGKLRKRDNLEDLGIDGKVVLKWIFKKQDGGTGSGLIWLRIRAVGGLL
jgi:hypothetical protein